MKKNFLIVGGSGQFGITLSRILNKESHQVYITTRKPKILKNKIKKYGLKRIKILKLNILNKKNIRKILQNNFDYIFFFAGQSSPSISFKKPSITLQSNYQGCKNFLDELLISNKRSKFINATSSEIFASSVKKIKVNSQKKPISPYGKSKLQSYQITKKYRDKFNLLSYNAIIFNTESTLRDKRYLIPKICIAAIKSKLRNEKTKFGNLNIVREWNWCEEQCLLLIKMIKLKANDYILSNGRPFSGIQMMKYAFEFFDLNYKDYIETSKSFLRKKDFSHRISDKSKILKIKSKVYGKILIYKLLKFYINEKRTGKN